MKRLTRVRRSAPARCVLGGVMGLLVLPGAHSSLPAQPTDSGLVRTGAAVRLATSSGRIVCQASAELLGREGLRVYAGTAEPDSMPWTDVQWLWVGRKDVVTPRVSPAGRVALAVGILGTAAVVQYGRSLEGFAPIGLMAINLVVAVVSWSIWMIGDEFWPPQPEERIRWTSVPLVPHPSPVALTEADVTRVCP